MKEKATIVDTFKNLGRDWMQVRGAGWSDSYRVKTETMLDRHLFSSLGAFPITQITAPQLLAVLRPIEATGKTDLAHTLMQLGIPDDRDRSFRRIVNDDSGLS